VLVHVAVDDLHSVKLADSAQRGGDARERSGT
jgi:hypothetical protein